MFVNLSAIPLKPYRGEVFRNIFTCSPTQHILDDLCEAEDFELVDQFIQLTSEIDHQAPAYRRPFQYGHIEDEEIVAVFKKENWRSSRFSDGQSYGVFYSAEDELTSIYEASWWAYQLAQDNVWPRGEVYTSDRVMYRAFIEAEQLADLTREENYFESLIDPYDYHFCQSLGRAVQEKSWQALRTHSARRKRGICIPVFSLEVIKEPLILYYLKFHVNPDGVINVVSGHDEANFSIRASELLPYETKNSYPTSLRIRSL